MKLGWTEEQWEHHNTYHAWTEEDQQIWRDRKMKPHTILYRYQQHVKECQIMTNLVKIPIKPGHAKFIALQFMP